MLPAGERQEQVDAECLARRNQFEAFTLHECADGDA
jgi:hypothetical protein